MLPELKEFATQIKKEKLQAENQLLAAQITEKLIQEATGDNWVPILDIQPTTKVYLCRHEMGVFDKGFVYFAAEWTLSIGWREIGLPLNGHGVFDFVSWDEIEVLI